MLMPFTVTHIMAILPLFILNRNIPIVALAVGAMVPDFTLFFPLSGYDFSHSVLGVLFYCLPVGMILYCLFVHLGKPFIIDASPAWLYSRLLRFRHGYLPYTLTNVRLISCSIILGAFTHVSWDSFTHREGWGLELIPSLLQTVTLLGVELPWYKVMQYASSLIGLPMLALYSFVIIIRLAPEKTTDIKRYRPITLFSIMGSFMAIPIIIAGAHLQGDLAFNALLGNTLIDSISVSLVLLLLYSLLNWRYHSSE